MLRRLVRQTASAGVLWRALDVQGGLGGGVLGFQKYAASNKADVQKVVAVLYQAGDAAKEPKLLGENSPAFIAINLAAEMDLVELLNCFPIDSSRCLAL